jgi:CRISPR-associated protein Cas6
MAVDAVDVAFALKGGTIPADHGWRLFRLLAEQLDWLDAESRAGVHPIRGARSGSGASELYIGARGRLMLRLPGDRAEQSSALSGSRLDLGDGIEIGAARFRLLFAHGTLYSPFVSLGVAEEIAFQRALSGELERAGIECKVICGKARRAQADGKEILGFSVMLHALSPEHSLRMQEAGLGGQRKLGCGIFVPHRSAAAVGW